jgi:hypothetical protein
MVEFYAVKAEKVVKNYKVHGQRQRREVSFVEVQSLVDEPEFASRDCEFWRQTLRQSTAIKEMRHEFVRG